MSTFDCYLVCIKLPLRLWLDILIRMVSTSAIYFEYLLMLSCRTNYHLCLIGKKKKRERTRISYIFLMPHQLLLISYISLMTIDYMRGQKNDMFMQQYGFLSSVVLCFQLYSLVFPVSDGANLVEIVIQVKKVILLSFKSRKKILF